MEQKQRNEFNEAVPQIFNREGLVKKNPNGNKATARDFNRIFASVQDIRNKVLEGAELVIELPFGVLHCSNAQAVKIAAIRDNDDQPDIIAALLLNGWKVSAL